MKTITYKGAVYKKAGLVDDLRDAADQEDYKKIEALIDKTSDEAIGSP